MTAPDITFEEISALARQFVEREIRPLERDVDLNRDIDLRVYKEQLRKSRSVGLYAHAIPAEHGGGGFNAVQQVAVALEAGRASMGLAQILLGPPAFILNAGPEQWDWFTQPCIDGEQIVAIALTEASGGSDLSALRTMAKRDGDQFAITGEKAFTSHAEVADYIVVLAVTDPDAPSAGRFTAFIVPGDAPGLSIQVMPKMGWHGGSICQVSLDRVTVDEQHVLGEVNKGWQALFGSWINAGRLGVAAICTGSTGYALELALEYSRERVTFGQRLADHQVIQFWLADMQIAFDSALAVVMRAADMLDGVSDGRCDEKTVRNLVAGAKVFTSETLGRSVDHLLQIHGGAGVLTGTPVERLYRDCRIFRIGEGSSEMLRQQIARSIVGRAPAG
jgi:acyl-CoA dehydrogenase